MAARKKATRKPAGRAKAGKPRPVSHRARIRMYRVGLGDCFLLTFYTPAARHILIDCGMFKGSRLNPSEKEKDIQLKVVESIAKESGGKLDVVVITHEHMDHVSIFNSARELFEKIDFGEVWFGWVEDPGNKDAKRLREKYEKLQVALQAALTGLQGLDGSDLFYKDLHEGIAGVAEFTGLGAGGKKIAEQPRDAMNFVKDKVDAKKRRYGSPGDIWEFAGVKVYVLGPPTSEKQLRIMERVGATYDHAFGVGVDDEETEGNATAISPFAQQWRQEASIDPNRQLRTAYENTQLNDIATLYNGAHDEWRRIDHLELESASDLALQMDKFINNTSLVLAFELPGKERDILLFPGDAQVGNWLSWFEIKETKEGEAAKKEFDIPDMLRRTIFYKVGHHGSHNATLKQALEQMVHPKLVAMIPTNASFAKTSKHWTMPAPKLNKELKDHTEKRLLRIDQGRNRVPDPLKDQEANWQDLENVTVDDLFIDYYV
jgi:beta-lactamase superfamily II metal-dependent hydrolase